MLLDRASWKDIEELAPIQQWCAYYLWDRRQRAEFGRMRVLAAAALKDVDGANSAAATVAELTFPEFAEQRRKFYDGGYKLMNALRGVSIRFRRADGRGK